MLGLIFYIILCHGFVQSYLLGNYISDKNIWSWYKDTGLYIFNIYTGSWLCKSNALRKYGICDTYDTVDNFISLSWLLWFFQMALFKCLYNN